MGLASVRAERALPHVCKAQSTSAGEAVAWHWTLRIQLCVCRTTKRACATTHARTCAASARGARDGRGSGEIEGEAWARLGTRQGRGRQEIPVRTSARFCDVLRTCFGRNFFVRRAVYVTKIPNTGKQFLRSLSSTMKSQQRQRRVRWHARARFRQL